VRKTSVYLSEAQADRLSRLSKQEGRPQAEIIREAITAYGVLRPGDRQFSLDGVALGDGTSIADVAEEELLQGFGE
jgi:predicted transcriptional regulator